MIISEEHNFIFIAIGKTGTTSIENALSQFDDYDKLNVNVRYKEHAPISELEGQIDLDRYYKFCFVRNPWDLVVSKYHYHNNSYLISVANLSPLSKYFFKKWIKGVGTAKEYAYTSKSLNNLNVQYEYPLVDMHSFILSSRGEVIMDDIFRYEDIEENFNKAVENIGLDNVTLPHKNKSRNYFYSVDGYRDLYDYESRQIVADHFKRDIDRFGYEF